MLCCNSGNKVRQRIPMSLALLMIFIAELRRSIDTAIPEIINFLNDSDTKVRLATTEALLGLSDRGKTANLLIFALLMKIIAEFRPSIATALSKFSEHGKIAICSTRSSSAVLDMDNQ